MMTCGWVATIRIFRFCQRLFLCETVHALEHIPQLCVIRACFDVELLSIWYFEDNYNYSVSNLNAEPVWSA